MEGIRIFQIVSDYSFGQINRLLYNICIKIYDILYIVLYVPFTEGVGGTEDGDPLLSLVDMSLSEGSPIYSGSCITSSL